jgi:hypothetical protein
MSPNPRSCESGFAGADLNSSNVIDIRQNIARELENWVALQGESAPEPPRTPAACPKPAEHRWRISPILDELKRRKTLTTEEHAAASRFLYEFYLGVAADVGPKSQRYERRSASATGIDPVLEKIHFAKETERAIAAIDSLYYPALRWLVGTLGEGKPLSSLGEQYAPGLGAQTQSARCGAAVALLCASLCRHYGIKHRLTLEARIESLSRVLLEQQPKG